MAPSVKDELETLLPKSGRIGGPEGDEEFGRLPDDSGWYAQLYFGDGWTRPQTPKILRDYGWYIQDIYKFGEEVVVRVEKSD